ncbi:unnamed protein product [Lactuca virosa]|uniref:Serine carboxypeptidase-like 18 n=1 Tax=Lactuca virosa TaxID=75947 RepID=A0AAU9N307_9ASTR|nr:unnamed protein product [Lactuca virosa]
MDHPKFLNNPLYLGSDSYGGIVVPMIVQEIYNGNEVGGGPHINIKGYVLGNPSTDASFDCNSKIPFAHRMGLLSDAIYKSTKENCHGEYLNVDPNNSVCTHYLHVVDKCLERIRKAHILEPFCDTLNALRSDLFRRRLRFLDNTSMDIWSLPQLHIQGCREDNYLYSYTWANRKDVREALDIRELPIIDTLLIENCRALVYSGDHDMVVPYLGTLNWIESLNLLVVDDWRPWFVDEQVAGYTMKYSNHDYNLTFATIKGGGHTAPEYKPKECLSMLTRWLANEDL